MTDDQEQRISPERQNISPEEEFSSSEKPVAMEANRYSNQRNDSIGGNSTQESLLESPIEKGEKMQSTSKNTFDDAGEFARTVSSKPPLLLNVEIFDGIAYPAGSSGSNRSSWMNLDSNLIDSNLDLNIESPVIVTSSSASTYGDQMIAVESGGSTMSINQKAFKTPRLRENDRPTQGALRLPAKPMNYNIKDEEKTATHESQIELPILDLPLSLPGSESQIPQDTEDETFSGLPELELPPSLTLGGVSLLSESEKSNLTHGVIFSDLGNQPIFPFLKEFIMPDSRRSSSGNSNIPTHVLEHLPISPFLKDGITPDFGEPSGGKLEQAVSSNLMLPDGTLQLSEKSLQITNDGLNSTSNTQCITKEIKEIHFKPVFPTCSTKKVVLISSDGKDVIWVRYKGNHNHSAQPTSTTSSQPPSSHKEKAQDGTRTTSEEYKWKRLRKNKLQLGGSRGTLRTYCPTKKEEDKSGVHNHPPSSSAQKHNLELTLPQEDVASQGAEYKWKRLRENELKLGEDRGTLRTYFKCEKRDCRAKKKKDKCLDGQIKFHYDGVHNHPPPSSAQKHNLELKLPRLPQEDVAPQGAELDTSAQIAINAFLASFVKDHKDSNHQGEDHKGDPRS